MTDKKVKSTTDTENIAVTDEASIDTGKVVKLLKDGVAVVQEPMGRHFMAAQRVAKHPSDIFNYLIIATTKIDGKKITMNDLKSMPAADLMMLTGKVANWHSDEDDEENEDDDDFLSQQQNILSH